MNLVETIKTEFNEMTRSEKKTAAHFLKKPSDFAFLTLDKIAAKVELSTTSVLRFCRRMGYEGYRDFQEAVRDEGLYQPNLPEKYRRVTESPNRDELYTKAAFGSIACIQESFDGFPPEEIEKAVSLLSGAKRVFTLGLKESHALSHYLYTRLFTVRKNVFMLSSDYDSEPVLSLEKGDTVVVFLFHRYTRATLKLLPLLKERGADLVLITSPPSDSVENFGTVLLNCRTDAKGIKNSFVAPLVLSDYLCNAVAVSLGDSAMEYMKNLEDLYKAVNTLD